MTDKSEQAISEAINNAQQVYDPLEGLLERAAEDAGAPFEPEVLQALADIKKAYPARYESIRAKLKTVLGKSKGRISTLEQAVSALNGEDTAAKAPPQNAVLLDLAKEVDLFHSPDGAAYAGITINGHLETWPVESRGFLLWLLKRFYDNTAGAPNEEAIKSAIRTLEARALHDGPESGVHVRVAESNGRIYLDLADPNWGVVEITPDGYGVVQESPVRFRRSEGMMTLPAPQPGGSIDILRKYLNVKDDNDFVLVVAWLLAALSPHGPYPVLVITGEQGSAKSCFSKLVRSLVDPYLAPVRSLPRETRDLFVTAKNTHVLAFDNVSDVAQRISDALCCFSTGGGLALRRLYTDQDEIIFEAMRPIILNGIGDVVTRADLADRALFLVLEAIPEEKRVAEKDLLANFEKDRPLILGALLDALSTGLRRLPETKLEYLPRMADFAKWITACEPAIWSAGTFEAAYTGNREDMVVNIVDCDPVASAIMALMKTREGEDWVGTASELLDALDIEAGDKVTKTRDWPKSASALSNRVTRAATFLRKLGIDINRIKVGKSRTRTIIISSKPGNGVKTPSAPSAPSVEIDDARANKELAFPWADGGQTLDCGQADSAVRPNPLESQAKEEADGADAEKPTSCEADKGEDPEWVMDF